MLAVAPHPIAAAIRDRARPQVAPAVRHFRRLRVELRSTSVHYAAQHGLDPAILAALAREGSRFVVGSAADVTTCMAAGVPAGDLVFGVAAPRRELAAAAAVGVRTFVVDTPEAVADVGLTVPGAAVLARLGSPTREGTRRPSGPTPLLALGLLNQAAASGLDAAGFSLQCAPLAPSASQSPSAPSGRGWRWALGASAYLFARLRAAGHRPWLLDLGAGYPRPAAGAATAGTGCNAPVHQQLHEVFGAHRPSTMASFSYA